MFSHVIVGQKRGYETHYRQEVVMSVLQSYIHQEVIAMRITESIYKTYCRLEVISQCSNLIYTSK